MKGRLLLIAYYFPPLGLSGVQRTAGFARYLSDDGWDVTVLTAQPSSYFAFDQTLLDDVLSAGVAIEETASLDPTRLPGRRTVGMPSDSRRTVLGWISQFLFQPDNKIGWLPFAYFRAGKLHRKNPFDAVLSSAPPYTSHLVAARIARIFRIPLLIDYRDDWIGNPRHAYPTRLHRRLAVRQERRVLRSAAIVTTINNAIAENILSRAEGLLKASSVRTIPHGYDSDLVRAVDEHRKEPGAQTVVFLYTGVFYDAQKPDTFLRALSQLFDDRPELRDSVRARFVGLLPSYALALIRELKLEQNVEVCGYRDHRETVLEIAKADVLWMTIGNSPGAEGISTGKLYEYFGSRKPILALVPDGVAANDVHSYRGGTVVDPDDIDGARSAIESIVESVVSGRKQEIDENFVSALDRRNLALEISGLLSHLVNSSGTE
jgi:glycosyltransferase involved in cell wall biosynthesis